ncbi:MAG: type II secretion system F family protein [Polyangiales bacterium]
MPVISIAALSALLIAAGIAMLAYRLALVAPLPRPTLGHRGLQRTRALHEAPAFATLEPALRWLAALIARIPSPGLRAPIETELLRSGDFLGLCPDECLALCALAAVSSALLAQLARRWLDHGAAWPLLVVALAAPAPWLRVRAESARRQRSVARSLPQAIDLLALAMSAGLDFTGALDLLVRELHTHRDPFVEELTRLLQELTMGSTRSKALLALAARVPCAAIHDFVGAAVQAEQKGNPLAEVLGIQARMLRMRRSVAAEEAAARASVLLVLPMMLMLAAVVLLMLGPFIVNGMGI